jgi:SNF2 family DNA or RNA helicase
VSSIYDIKVRLTLPHRLNLAIASRIYLLEPQWNPSIEFQAIGRAHRLGQVGQVSIIRYVMMHTVEEVWELANFN